MKQDFIVGTAITALGIVYLIMSANIAVSGGAALGIVDARFMPYILGALMCVLGCMQIILSRVAPRTEAAAKKKTDYRSLVLSAVLMVLYVAFIELLGFVLVSVIYLFAEFWILTPPDKPRRPVLYALIALVAPVVTYFIFRYAFDMLLPVGPLSFL